MGERISNCAHLRASHPDAFFLGGKYTYMYIAASHFFTKIVIFQYFILFVLVIIPHSKLTLVNQVKFETMAVIQIFKAFIYKYHKTHAVQATPMADLFMLGTLLLPFHGFDKLP